MHIHYRKNPIDQEEGKSFFFMYVCVCNYNVCRRTSPGRGEGGKKRKGSYNLQMGIFFIWCLFDSQLLIRENNAMSHNYDYLNQFFV